MAEVAKDLTAGTIGGAAQLIVGHPFDTIKVKLQSQPAPPPGQLPKYSGAVDAVKQTIAAEGPRGLYKGMGAPLATVAALNAVLFSARGQMEALLRSEPGVPLTVDQQGCRRRWRRSSGFLSGMPHGTDKVQVNINYVSDANFVWVTSPRKYANNFYRRACAI